MKKEQKGSGKNLPPIRKWQLRLFSAYVSFYLSRHFHNVYLLRSSPLASFEGWPVLICLNHPSWWDPLIALHLSRRLFKNRLQYAPIANEGLQKYQFLEQLGFFGIDPRSTIGAARFFRLGRQVLKQPDGVLWVTAEGHFTDVRQRPVELQPGVGHLAHASERFAILPVALEYAFWNERSPEAFINCGEPVFVRDGRSKSPSEWLACFTSELASAQDILSVAVIARRAEQFESLLSGVAGVSLMYDGWRAAKSFLSGSRFRAEHGGGS